MHPAYPPAWLGIGDANRLLSSDRRNDFLPSQCCTTALNQLQAMVGFISTIDIQVNAGCGIQIQQLDIKFASASSCAVEQMSWIRMTSIRRRISDICELKAAG